MNRAVMLRIAACAVLGLGSALLIAALLLSTYTAGKVAKIPLDIDTTLVSDGHGTALDPNSLSTQHFVIDRDVPLVAQVQLSVEAPANANLVTLQAGSSVRRTDRQKDSGLLLAIVDTVTLNRRTALAASDDTHSGGAVQKPRTIEDDEPPAPILLQHDGLSYRFPFHTKKESYSYFDPIAQEAFKADYQGQEDVNGLNTYRFTQNIGYNADGKLSGPVKYPSLYPKDEDGEVTATASAWNIDAEDPDEKITMTRYYAAQRTFWVDPVSGTIVKSAEHANHYYAREPEKPEVTLTEYKVTSTEETVEQQVSAARDERDRLALWSRVLPISLTATGLIGLVGGVVLGWFGARTEAALIDPGLDTAEHGFFEGFFGGRSTSRTETVSGADAETEKLPAQHPLRRQLGEGAQDEPPDQDLTDRS